MAKKIYHGGTEGTEEGRMARFARPTLLLRDLRASVVNLFREICDRRNIAFSTRLIP
jgi:hypothetical protein